MAMDVSASLSTMALDPAALGLMAIKIERSAHPNVPRLRNASPSSGRAESYAPGRETHFAAPHLLFPRAIGSPPVLQTGTKPAPRCVEPHSFGKCGDLTRMQRSAPALLHFIPEPQNPYDPNAVGV